MKVMWRGRHVRLAPAFLLSLLLRGPVSSSLQNPNQPENMVTFDDADLQFLVDEGRRQIDAQRSDFEHVQSRAQLLLTVGLAVLGFSAGGLGWLTRVHGVTYAADLLLWIVAFGVVLIGVGLSASVVVVQANFDRIDTTQMTGWTTPVLRSLAEDYAKSVRVGEITVADRVTVFRLATRYISWGAVLTAVVFVITR